LDLFEFIIGMISVILALAVAQLFLGVADLVRHRARVSFYLGHSVWLINLFLLTFLHWWSIWAFRDLPWNFGMFFFSLIGPSLMFFAAAVLNPKDFPEQGVELAQYFLGIRRSFFAVLIVMLVLFTVDGPFFGTEPVFNPARVTQLVVLAIISWGLIADGRNSHTAISITTLVILCALVVFRFFPR
jgi:hypothetical protein